VVTAGVSTGSKREEIVADIMVLSKVGIVIYEGIMNFLLFMSNLSHVLNRSLAFYITFGSLLHPNPFHCKFFFMC